MPNITKTEILDLLANGDSWIKGDTKPSGPYCLLGAVETLIDDDYREGHFSPAEGGSNYNETEALLFDSKTEAQLLDSIVISGFAERTGTFRDSVVSFNDHPATTFEDVRTVVENSSLPE